MKLVKLFKALRLAASSVGLRHILNLLINFDRNWYKGTNPDVAEWGGNPLEHFLRHGIAEGRSPAAWFSLTAFSTNKKLCYPQIELAKTGHSAEDIGNLVLNFDAAWYRRTNADVAEWGGDPLRHFLEHGIAEGRSPSEWFSLRAFNESRGLDGLRGGVSDVGGDIKEDEYRRLQAERAESYRNCEQLLIFFNVARDTIGGGMLSINRFVKLAQEITGEDSSTMVAMSGVPLENKVVDYSMFVAAAPPVDFEQIRRITRPQRVTLFVPEFYAVAFLQALSREDRRWLAGRESLRIVVMNQNNDLMPPLHPLQWLTSQLTKDVIISTAHRRYCTQRLATSSGIGVKQLTPLLPTMPYRPFGERRKVFMLSPDPLGSAPGELTRADIVQALKARLPDFEFVTVENMALSDYLDLASHAMFSLTFGEGMDGYFIEPILSGGIAFSCYNRTFFPQSFDGLPTLAPDWDSLTRLIAEQVPRLAADETAYAKVSEQLQAALGSHFSHEISRNQLAALLAGEVDFRPEPVVAAPEASGNREFPSVSFKDGRHVTQTPDGLLVEHYGSDLYATIDQLYRSGHCKLVLREGCEYVLVDIGANVGLSTLYLARKYPAITEVFAYEPIPAIADVAQRNFRGIRDGVNVTIKKIGLTDRYDSRAMQYFPEHSTAFSTENMILNNELKERADARLSPRAVEMEVVPASAELAEIAGRLNGRRLALHCDAGGSEFNVFRDLERSGGLEQVDAAIVKSYFRKPSELRDILVRAGFHCEMRLVSVRHRIYVITAFRGGSDGPK